MGSDPVCSHKKYKRFIKTLKYEEIYFKESVHETVGTGKSTICTSGCQAGTPSTGTDAACYRQNFFFPRETSVLLSRPFS